ncbi:MAG: transglycosylase domain-containing protein [Firmicutes bacterium]|nr:transglycosylase domain-containing protein [Bacillota bacterium]
MATPEGELPPRRPPAPAPAPSAALVRRRARRRPSPSGGPDGRHRRRGVASRLAASAWAALLGGGGVFALAVAVTPLHLPALGVPSRLVDRGGRTIALLGGFDRRPVPLSDVPLAARQAIVATEDHTFWYNPGIDPVAIVRAAIVDLRAHAVVEGGSTLTQQLAKNLFLTGSRTFTRKAAELFWTFSLATHLPKARILELYFNTVYFGEGAYGIEAAAETYFGLPARRLDLAQCALLAGLVDAPTAYDPYLHPALARSRRAWVAHRMRVMGMITAAQEAAVDAAPLRLAGHAAPPPLDQAPYVTQYALAELVADAPDLAARLADGGYVVRTTADLPLQYAARAAYDANIPAVAYTGADGVPQPEAALAAVDARTGGILALVGGRSFALTPFDRATDALRQPGSSFKPILYSALLLTGTYTASSVIWDRPTVLRGAGGSVYRPENAGRVFLGPILMRRALAVSDNVAAVRFAYALGMGPVVAQARRMGYTGPIAPNLTSVLGSNPATPLEMASVYASLANGGRRVSPYLVAEVDGPGGHVLYRRLPAPVQTYDARAAAIVTDLLRSVTGPQGTAANLGPQITFPAVGKTGTSSGMHDGWFIGYSPTLSAAVWVGDDTGHLGIGGEGSTTAGPIWASFMAAAYRLHPWGPFPRPPGLVGRTICSIDGLLANATCPAERDLYAAGTQPTRRSPIVYTGGATLWVSDPTRWYFAYHSRVLGGRPLSGGRPLVPMFLGG